MAKSGKVSFTTDFFNPVDATEDVRDVAQVTPVVATVGSIAVELLRANPTESVVFAGIPPVATDERTVAMAAANEAASVHAEIAAEPGYTLNATLTFDGGALKNAPVTNAVASNANALAGAINARLAAAKPAFSVASLINMIEDEAKELGKSIVVTVDQAAETVKVFTINGGEAENKALVVEAFTNLSAGNPGEKALMTVDTAPATADTAQFGE